MENQVLIAIDKLAKIGVDAVAQMLIALTPSSNLDAAKQFVMRLKQFQETDGEWDALLNQLAQSPSLRVEAERVRETLKILQSLTSNLKIKVRCDLSVARGLGYYTVWCLRQPLISCQVLVPSAQVVDTLT